MVIRVTAQGTTRVKRVVAAGTTIVKSITVGLPQIQGQASVGVLSGLDDVNNSNRQDGYVLLWDSDTSKFIYVSPRDEARSAVDAADLGGDGEFTYDSATGIFSYRGPTAAEVRAHFSNDGAITYNSETGVIYYSFDSDIQSVKTHIIPSQNEVYDLGDSNYRFRDLWLRGTTIHLGSLTVNDSNGTFVPKDSAGNTARIDISGSTTDDLTEGSTNLYYTNQRARSSLTVNTDATNLVQYDSTTGVFTFRDSDYARSDIQDTFRQGLILPSDKKIEFKEDLGGEIIADFFENQGNMFIRRTNNDALSDPYVEVGYVEPDYTERTTLSTGNIYIMTRDNGFLYIKSFDGNRDIAHFHDQGPVQLYYNNNKKFETTDSGGLLTGNLQVTQNATVYGNLRVDGTTTTINSTTLSVNDKNIVLADSAVDSAASNGAGITVGGSGASIVYNHLTGNWDLNRPLGSNINAISNYTTTNLTEGSNLYYTTARANNDFDDRLATKSTADLLEDSSNLYYTTARHDSDFDARFDSSFSFNFNLASTDSLSEGSNNIYYLSSRFDSDLALKTTNDLSEGPDNLYYTRGRFNSALGDSTSQTTIRSYFSASGDLNYNSGTGLFSISLADFTTDSVAEGSNNLYYTTARHDSDFNVSLDNAGLDGTGLNYNSANNTLNIDSAEFTAMFTTDNLNEGSSNLYYTTARADSDARHAISGSQDISYDPNTGVISIDVEQVYSFANFDSDFRTRLVTTTTDSIGEGSNLYYTTNRADSDARYAIQVVDNGGDGSLTYHAPTGVITYTGPSAAEVRSHFTSSGDITYDSSTGTFSVDVSQIYTAEEFDSDLGATSTSALPEGTNLYYTTSRADSDAKHAISGGTSIVYSSDTGIISSVQAIDSTDNVTFNEITNRGTTIVSPAGTAVVGVGNNTVIDRFAHNGKTCSFEFLIHLTDSAPADLDIHCQVTKMLGTYSPHVGVVSNEFGTVFTYSQYFGELDIVESAGDIALKFSLDNPPTGALGTTINAKVHKTILR